MRALHVSLSVALASAAACARTSADRPVDRGGAVAERVDAKLVAEAEARKAAPPASRAGVESGRPIEITGVFVDTSLATECGIPIGPDAFFEYDAAALAPEDNPLLHRVAECLTTGPLHDRKIELRGHADRRGRGEYRDKVGMSRAESVSEFLATHGVDPETIVVIAADETGAAPEAPSDWPYERRVDIVLLPAD